MEWNIHLYDPLTIVAAIPKLRDRFYDSRYHVVQNTNHRIIGLCPEETAVKNPVALRNFIKETERTALQNS